MKPQITSSFPVPRRRRIAPLKKAETAEQSVRSVEMNPA